MLFFSFSYVLTSEDNPIEIRERLIKYNGKRVVFDLEKIICTNQVKIAIERALRAEKRGTMVAKVWGIEVLLHLAGTHQITEALSILNIDLNTTLIGIIQDSESPPMKDAKIGLSLIDSDLLEINEKRLQKLSQLYGLPQKNLCEEIISKGVDVVLNHE